MVDRVAKYQIGQEDIHSFQINASHDAYEN